MSLYDRIVPSSACQWGRLTAVWPWQTVRPHLDLRADGAGGLYVIVMPGEYATGGPIPNARPHPLTQADFPLLRPTPPRPWLPWRKRR